MDYSRMTVALLNQQMKNRGIGSYFKKTKAALIKILQQADRYANVHTASGSQAPMNVSVLNPRKSNKTTDATHKKALWELIGTQRPIVDYDPTTQEELSKLTLDEHWRESAGLNSTQ